MYYVLLVVQYQVSSACNNTISTIRRSTIMRVNNGSCIQAKVWPTDQKLNTLGISRTAVVA